MTPKLSDCIEAGKSLDADEREIAALALQQVDRTAQAEIDAAWDETIDRRFDDLANGEVTPVSGRETIAIARAIGCTARMNLDWSEHPEARADFLDAHRRYDEIGDGTLGDEFIDAAESAAELILRWPDEAMVRTWHLGKFPYRLVYTVRAKRGLRACLRARGAQARLLVAPREQLTCQCSNRVVSTRGPCTFQTLKCTI
ncbi:MAG: addiction module protein [Gulosibacter sp.]|uniref:addiction module protein n=1 Tax=Gulosibacter sp. TaxID=2817531 RepID=UPI003F914B52